jgi:ribulose-phosphate 3-epimerase
MSRISICPTVTAYNPHQYRAQIERLQPFAKRIHIDLMDGEFTPNTSQTLEQTWWPEELQADIHLMYQQPMNFIDQLIQLHPEMVVIQAEADVNHAEFAQRLHKQGIQVGLSILQGTSVESVAEILPNFDQTLVFSGNLGEHGGKADLHLLDKVREIREKFPEMEISWDGGINAENAAQLIEAGVTVLNAGGYIHNASDPAQAYATLESITQ